jgi:hypothetical protein
VFEHPDAGKVGTVFPIKCRTGRRDLLKTRSTRIEFRHRTFGKCNPNWQLNMSRRRWESNPRIAALQAATTPCDLSVINSASMPGVKRAPPEGWSYDLRRVACLHYTSRTLLKLTTAVGLHPPYWSVAFLGPTPRNRTSPDCFEGSHASSTIAGHEVSIPTWTRTRA